MANKIIQSLWSIWDQSAHRKKIFFRWCDPFQKYWSLKDFYSKIVFEISYSSNFGTYIVITFVFCAWRIETCNAQEKFKESNLTYSEIKHRKKCNSGKPLHQKFEVFEVQYFGWVFSPRQLCCSFSTHHLCLSFLCCFDQSHKGHFYGFVLMTEKSSDK